MNHDNEYHDNINYGNRFPEGWYFQTNDDSTIENDYEEEYL
tara:strand:+ start:1207 stop:1329 length:123 start_codon:yes stop_codon:yes gene_type:complete